LSHAQELARDGQELNAVEEGRLTEHLATVVAARYAVALAGWNGEVTDEFGRKLRALRELCQDVVEFEAWRPQWGVGFPDLADQRVRDTHWLF